ncbi:MAG: hypothetical protein AABO41_04435 [Acidobacteriota bacterium]
MNIFEAPSIPVPSALTDYNDAVNASRFVKGFGIAVLVYSVLLFLGINLLSSAIGLGTGLFIFRYDAGKFYKVLGVVVMVLALVAPLPFLSPSVLAGSVLWKGTQVLSVLKRSPQDDPDWSETRSRTILGIVASSAGLLVSIVIAVLVIIAIAVIVAESMH